MVKGTAKQAVIINPGEKSGFEQAIFIISDEKQGLRISSSEELLRLADSIAAEHTVTSLSAAAGWKRRIPIAAAFIAGVAAAGIFMAVAPMFGL